jgi:parallel beta helix pectate lyase-like protein
MRVVICLLFILSIARPSNASVWHVSPTALPAIPVKNQFRTIQESVRRVNPGDVILIHSGVYRETVIIEKNGTATKPIRFEAAPDANVVVTGLDRLTSRRKEKGNVYSTVWTHHFIPRSKYEAHPDDEYHRLIGRAEQVVVDGNLLRQTLQRDQLSPGSFYVDLEGKRLYICPPGSEDLTSRNVDVEAATRSLLLDCEGDYISVRGIHFSHAANPAQTGGTAFRGRGDSAEDCIFEDMNGAGAAFVGPDQVAQGCVFQNNGQLGFAANRAHNLLITECTVRNNNTKGFNKQWEAGGTKVVLSRGVVFDKNRVIENHGPGIWLDTGNESCTVRNCLIAANEDAGIFYEISYGLHAHDNVIIGNGFASTAGAWGGQAGIVLSSSPNCVVERNLLVGNREGFNFREQSRVTPRIDSRNPKQEELVWNHDERISNNVIVYNRDAQTRAWFGVNDQRHWPGKLQEPNPELAAPPTVGASLEELHFDLSHNVYAREANQPLFIWGTSWLQHIAYSTIADIQAELGLEQSSQLLPLEFSSLKDRDFRLPRDSPVFQMECYPRGKVPDVKLGKTDN